MRRSVLLVPLILLIPGAGAVVAPINDSFAGAVDVFSPVTAGTTEGATTQPGEPLPCGAMGATLWFRYTPAVSGTVNLNTEGSAYDTVLAVYTGSSLPALSLLACDDDAGPGTTSQTMLAATAGTTYYIQLGGFGGTVGPYVLNVGFQPPACFTPENPSALLNACITIGSDTLSVPTPVVGPGPVLCVVGGVCVPTVTVGIGSTPVTIPTPEGYVEVTVLCGTLAGCRVTLP